MATLLYQCPSGLSGDMNLGAMIALGVDPVALETELRKLPYHGWSLQFTTDQRQGISGTRCDVQLESAHTHTHEKPETHHHHHRHYSEIRDAIQNSALSEAVKCDAIACFHALAVAEGAVHGIEPEAVHFHEVGAIDSIVDMVGAAICWDLLGVERIICSTLELGGGTVKCAHGRMPVPAPATARLLEGLPFSAGATNKETTTPTGAAILVGKGCAFNVPCNGLQIKTGIGIGQRDDPNLANAVYVSLIDEDSQTSHFKQDSVIELAANIDDMTAEAISYLCQQLHSVGALDVWQTAATFKKGRLGCVVHALTKADQLSRVEQVFFTCSRTLGVRRHAWQRSILERAQQTLETPWGPVRVKTADSHAGEARHKFEHDDCARIATELGLGLEAVYQKLESLFNQNG